MVQISVIVPVYNVEKYLLPCIDSILKQTFQEFELILVDDGSPDKSGSICDEYAQKDQRVKVIHQENQGLSGARNTGLDIAEGKYVTFIDSDDIVAENFLSNMFLAIQRTNADIAVCSLHEFRNEAELEVYLSEEKSPSYKVFSGAEACLELYKGNGDISINACAKCYNIQILGDKRFPLGRLHEDQAYVPIICYEAKKIVAINQAMYFYRIRYDSITRSKFSLKRYDDIWALDKCIAFFYSQKENIIVEEAKKKRKRVLCSYLIYAKRDNIIVPKEYKISTVRALYYLKQNVSPMKYEYYLAQINPKLANLFEYKLKLKQILIHIKKTVKKFLWSAVNEEW